MCGSAQLAARTQSVFCTMLLLLIRDSARFRAGAGPGKGGGGWAVPVRCSLPSCERVRVRRCACGYGTRTAGPCVKEHEGPYGARKKRSARVARRAQKPRADLGAKRSPGQSLGLRSFE